MSLNGRSKLTLCYFELSKKECLKSLHLNFKFLSHDIRKKFYDRRIYSGVYVLYYWMPTWFESLTLQGVQITYYLSCWFTALWGFGGCVGAYFDIQPQPHGRIQNSNIDDYKISPNSVEGQGNPQLWTIAKNLSKIECICLRSEILFQLSDRF